MTLLRSTVSLVVILPSLLLSQIAAAQGLEKIRMVYSSLGCRSSAHLSPRR
jgi:hypothetical protein